MDWASNRVCESTAVMCTASHFGRASVDLKTILEKVSKVIDHDLDHFADHEADENNVTLVVTHIDYEAYRDAMRELRKAVGRPRLRDFTEAHSEE